ncbi:effector-associated constant component EACC1 [Actinomadura rudentiformis]|uniref:effector-associated constant component EACC1 n=1 Tax=Actinomadura rudentiformis TaxID=359158 RepID=UPI00298F9ED2|nr:hypothetical protein [Actinomadura rudentiformis]
MVASRTPIKCFDVCRHRGDHCANILIPSELGGLMLILLRVGDTASDQELHSLHDWLRAQGQLRSQARVDLHSTPPRPGDMGPVLDAVQVVLEAAAGAALGNVVESVLSWRKSRPSSPDVTIEYKGKTISIAGLSAEEIAALLKALDDEQP